MKNLISSVFILAFLNACVSNETDSNGTDVNDSTSIEPIHTDSLAILDTAFTKGDSIEMVNELVEELEELEYRLWKHYLTEDYFDVSENIIEPKSRSKEAITDGYTLTVRIKNDAAIFSYKDLKYSIKYISSTGSVIKSETIVFYDFVEPNSRSTLSKTIYPPRDAVSYEGMIVGVN